MVLIALVFNASSGIAIRIPLLILDDFTITNPPTLDQISKGRELIEFLMIFLFVLMTILCLPPIFLF